MWPTKAEGSADDHRQIWRGAVLALVAAALLAGCIDEQRALSRFHAADTVAAGDLDTLANLDVDVDVDVNVDVDAIVDADVATDGDADVEADGGTDAGADAAAEIAAAIDTTEVDTSADTPDTPDADVADSADTGDTSAGDADSDIDAAADASKTCAEACTSADSCKLASCNPKTGECEATPKPDGADCEDGQACTLGSTCQAGQCQGGAVAPPCGCTADSDCAAQDDGKLCNGSFYCDKSAPIWACKLNPGSVVTCQDPGEPCKSAQCLEPGSPGNDGSTAKCAIALAEDGTPCDDGSVCTGGDKCKGGACFPGETAKCDDGKACTSDSCDKTQGCVYSANLLACDDGNACTVGDKCGGGVCLAGAATKCDDGNDCTTDSCDVAVGCAVAPVAGGASCGAGKVCNGSATCVTMTPPGMALVPGGRFWMGCNPADDPTCMPNASPQHEVALTPYYIDISETTVGQYKKCVDVGVCTVPVQIYPQVSSATYPGLPDNPVNSVTWKQAQQYCKWRGPEFDLPTEAQWEMAARGSCTKNGSPNGPVCKAAMRKYPWGNLNATCQLAVFALDSKPGCGLYTTWEVGSVPLGDSPYGLHDMAGNVQEFTRDWYAAYSGALESDPTGPANPGYPAEHALRGGHYGSWNAAFQLSASARDHDIPIGTGSNYGFRCSRIFTCSSPAECDDGNPCNAEACQDGKCVHVPAKDGSPCTDGDACTVGDACKAAACIPGAVTACDDASACTTDSCSSSLGCANLATNCDDGNPCTADGCKAASGCTHVAAPNGQKCDDGNPCSGNDNCASGTCVGIDIPACSTEACNGVDDDKDGITDNVQCAGLPCTCTSNGLATCAAGCKTCPIDGDLAIKVDDNGTSKVVCAHDFQAWPVAPDSPNTFQAAVEGAVLDTSTGLQWQKDVSVTGGSTGNGQLTWAAAGSYCDSLVLAGKSDWRLPTMFELETLVDYGKAECPALPDVFDTTSCAFLWFWSASPKLWFFEGCDSATSWGVIMPSGISACATVAKANVRCVR